MEPDQNDNQVIQLIIEPIKPEITPIRLYPYQEPHVRKLSKILQHNYAALDYSMPGEGKTYTSSTLATIYKYPIILISLKTIFSVWEEIKAKHGVVIKDMISYESLRGFHGKQCNHPYLTRSADDQFYPTPYLIKLIDSGVMFVFDEMSKLKNRACQAHRAAHVIIKTMIARRSKSRVLLLSAMPSNDPIHVLSLIQLLGIIQDTKFVEYDKSNKIYQLKGIQELIDWCYSRNPVLSRQIINQYSMHSRKSIMEMSNELYNKIVFHHLSSFMIGNHSKLDIKNGYYPMDPDSLKILKQGRQVLRKAIRHRGDGLTGYKSVNWGQITLGLQLLGYSKLRLIAKMTNFYLTSHPTCKVVIGIWFVDQIEWLQKSLSQYGAVTLYGESKMKCRKSSINLFQQPNNNCRVLILNPTVGGMGISLDDRNGRYPRRMILVPDYRIMELVQCTGRVDRKSTKSKPNTMVRFVYTNEFQGESKILSSLIRKSNDARVVISNGSGLILPDSYQVENQNSHFPNFHLPPLPNIRQMDQQSNENQPLIDNNPILKI